MASSAVQIALLKKAYKMYCSGEDRDKLVAAILRNDLPAALHIIFNISASLNDHFLEISHTNVNLSRQLEEESAYSKEHEEAAVKNKALFLKQGEELAEARETLKRTQTLLDLTHGALTGARTHIDMVYKELAKVKAELAEARSAFEASQAELTKASSLLKTSQAELAETRTSLAGAQVAHDELNENLVDAQRTTKYYSRELISLCRYHEEQLEDLRAQLAKARATVKDNA